MPGWRREAEAVIAAALDVPPAQWIEWGAVLPAPGSRLASVVVTFVQCAPAPAERTRALGLIGGALVPDGTLVVVDHNRPRGRLAAFRALYGAPWVSGVSPLGRWRRLAYPVAREMQAAGFLVERLRLVTGERVQVVVGRRRRAE